MAHFAKLTEDGITVLNVHKVNDSDCLDKDNNHSEAVGIIFLTKLHGWSHWKESKPDGSLRKNGAYIGGIYDAARDAFIAPKRLDSWVLDETTCRYEAPSPLPADDVINGGSKKYYWDEPTVSWKEVIFKDGFVPGA